LDGGVAAPAAFFHNDFHHCGVEGVGFVDGGGAAFHVVDVGVFVHDDEGAFKLAHVFRVDAEVRLEGDFHVDAFGDVDEGSAGPHCGVEGGEFVVPGWDDGAEVFLDQVWVFSWLTPCLVRVLRNLLLGEQWLSISSVVSMKYTSLML